MPNLPDLLPDTTVTAGSLGALLSAIRKTNITFIERVVAFATGFASALFLAPYLCERLSIQSPVARNAVIFVSGYAADALLPRFTNWLDNRLPEILDAILNRRNRRDR